MRVCAVLDCRNSTENNTECVSFHGFPTDKEVFKAWVTFTRKPNFLPSFNSTICSAHFDDDAYLGKTKKLKPKAVPTKYADIGGTSFNEDVEMVDGSSEMSESDAVACILPPNTAMSKVVLNEDVTTAYLPKPPPLVLSHSSNLLSIVSSEGYARPTFTNPNDTIVLNYNRNILGGGSATCYMPMQINLPVNLLQMQMQGIRVPSKDLSTALSLPNQASHRPITYPQRQGNSSLGPIKVVDLEKLLQTPPKKDVETCTVEEILPKPLKKDNSTSSATPSNSTVKQSVKTEVSLTANKVTISQVLDCLKVILPAKFDLSRLIPNDKVASLVIKYLKFSDCTDIRNSVNIFLKIIVDASKMEEKVHGNDLSHPYLKINDIALQLALEKVLPTTFSMSDLTNQVLNCLCIVLNQELFTDGYHILRRKIRKFTSEGQKFTEIINQVSETKWDRNTVDSEVKKIKYSQLEISNKKLTSHEHKLKPKQKALGISDRDAKHNKPSAVAMRVFEKNSREKLDFVHEKNESKCDKRLQKVKNKFVGDECQEDKYVDKKSEAVHVKSHDVPLCDVVKLSKPDSDLPQNNNKNNDPDWLEKEGTNLGNKFKSDSKSPQILKAILSYLEKQKCSAKDVLVNFRLLFHLCRFLSLRSRQSTLQKLKEYLNLISEKNINKHNVNNFSKDLFCQEYSNFTVSQNQKRLIHKDLKLKMKAIVVLRNLIDFRKEDLLFMKENKMVSTKKSGYYNQCVPFCFQQHLSSQKYTGDYVKKLTHESYKQHKKIISKRSGNKVVFRVKYTKLEPGSQVFVRDFRNPSLGWLKGTVEKMKGSLKCDVRLESGETACCLLEQLRPIPAIETLSPNISGSHRVPRLVKPKQMFDL